MKDKANQQGFTLIELLVVIAIIGVLASMVFYSFSTARAKARDTRRVSDIKQLNNALLMYYAVNGNFPKTTGSGSNWPETTNIPLLVPTYIGQIPTSPSSPGSGCTNQHNGYNYRSLYGNSYSLTFCIGTTVGSLAPGYYAVTTDGIRKRYDMNGDGALNGTDVGYISSAFSNCGPETSMQELCDITLDGTAIADDACLEAILNTLNQTPGSYDIFPLPNQC